MRIHHAWFVVAIVLASAPADLRGQTATTGSIVGTASDSSGAVVPGVVIRLFSNETNTMIRNTKTDGRGDFVFTLLTPGSYRLEAAKEGFQAVSLSEVRVLVSQTTRANVQLRLGSLAQKVEVNSGPPVIATESAATGNTLESGTIQSLPLVNRNYYELLSLAPGTTSDINQGGIALGRGITDVQVSGQRTAAINFQIQGVNVNDFETPTTDKIPLPNPDFLQEFTVSTSLYDASEGRSGGLVNATIKSGQDRLHGAIFEYLENDKLNANDVFLKAQGKPRPVLKTNQFGGEAGWKIPFGRLYFFTGYQGWRERNGYVGGVSTAIPVLPSTRTAPTLGAAFGIDPKFVDPVAVNILNLPSNRFGGPFLIPTIPGVPGTVGPFAASAAAAFNSDQGVARLDRQWKNDTLSGTFFMDVWNTDLPLGGGFGPPAVENYRNLFLTPSWTHVFGSATTNQLRLGYNRLVHTVNTNGFYSTGQVGMNSPNANLYPGLPQFIVSGFVTLGASDPPTLRTQNTYDLSDDFTHVYRGHNFHVGLDVNQYRFNRAAASFGIGSLSFGSRTNPETGTPLNAMQAFLEGIPSTVRLARPGPFGIVGTLMYRATDFGFYGQDDWAATRRLELNLGLRLDSLEMPWDTLHNEISVFNLVQYASGGVGFALPAGFNLGGVTGTPGVAACGVDNCRTWGWGPRIGLAYKLTGSGNAVIRSGFGLYYDRVSQQPTLQASSSVPFGSAGGVSTNVVGMANAFSVIPLLSPGILRQRPQFAGLQSNVCRGGDCFKFPAGWSSPNPLAMNFHAPRAEMWNLTIDRQLGRNWGLEAGYVGSKGTSLVNRPDPNQPLVASSTNPITAFGQTITTNTINNEWLRVPYLGLDPGRFRITDNSASSIYNALQTSITRRLRPLFLQVGYTWSKSIDNTSQGGSHLDRLTRGGGSTSGQELSLQGPIGDQSNINNDRAVSDFDRTNHLTLTWVLSLPTPGFAADSALGRAALGSWAVEGVTVFQSGTPYTVFDSSGGTGFGAGSQGFTMSTANSAISGPIPSSTNPNQYLNAADFARAGIALGGGPSDTAFGTLGRNIFRSPFQQNWDFSLGKNFPIGEGRQMAFRASFFNVWNHPVFDIPDNGFTNVENIIPGLVAQGRPQPNFGVAHATVTEPRTIQFSLRFSF